jgi:hypothetical protein
MTNLITVSELVDRAAPPTEGHRTVWLRRARLWSVGDILPTATPQGGTRKHRVYSESTVFLAAVLFRISDFGVTTDILRDISDCLQNADQGRAGFSRAWHRIKRGIPIKYGVRDGSIYIGSGAYILITLPRPGRPRMQYALTDRGPEGVPLPQDDAPAIVLNLTRLWEELSGTTAEEDL